MVDGAVEGEERTHEARDVGVGRDDVGDGDAVGDGVDDVDALAVAVDGDGAANDVAVGVAVLVRGEAAGDGVIGDECLGERGLEVVEQTEWRSGVEEALLDVVGGEHGDVPGGERDSVARAGRRRDGAPGQHAQRRRGWHGHGHGGWSCCQLWLIWIRIR